ncbi:hypothetical protein L1049_005292 [Liquidambar formosana]|uniref:OCEL domain-containing protein n=1 Tax=Liquidambar formosana TaxID=63359 RepID=A0AAP0RQK6_LIQFO
MIIRLTPDLVDEIRRVEAQGGTARIKFGSYPNNPSGNVIDVDGKDFRFTWSREMGDLCDIYEERRSGEDGNGLLVESGCAWRKLNVQRILDESTTNHVKMRSEEAERKLKSRKAIVLDHGNPSMKNQMKALAAAESNPWRTFKQKKEPAFKKRKIELPQVGGPPKSSAFKSGLSSTTTTKGRRSASPLPSPPEQSGAPTSPFGMGNLAKGHMSVEDVMPIQVTSKENIGSSEKEIRGRAISAVRGTPGFRGNLKATPMDLQSMLITLLVENPKGMSLKALEKAIGDSIPNSVRKIETIIKKIANFQAPGRYFLKPGVELESFKKPSSESGSSPEDNRHQTPAPEDNRHQTPAPEDNHDQTPAPELSFAEKLPIKGFEEQAQFNPELEEESNVLDKTGIQQQSPDLFGDKKISDNSEGHAGSSSDSGSDSDSESDSSGSGSDSGSHSRSRSRSPVGSGSGSSTDSESDASSNSKEGSDEDVDIMTSDDDKEPKHKLEASELGLSVSPIPWRTPDGRPVQNEIDEKQDVHGSDAIEIEKDLPDDDQETEMDAMAVVTNSVCKEVKKPAEETRPFSPDVDGHREHQNCAENLFNERENMVNDSFKHEQFDSSNRISKGKSKRGSEVKPFDEKSEHTKRLKAGSLAEPPIPGGGDAQFVDGPHLSPPDRFIDDPYKGPNIQMMNRVDRDGNAEFGLLKPYNQANPGKSTSDFQQSGRRSVDHVGRARFPDTAERPGKRAESLGRGFKYSERSFHAHEGSVQKDKAYRETQDEDGYPSEKKVPRNFKEGGVGGKQSMPFDSQYRKHSELVGKFRDAGQVSNAHMGCSPKDNNKTGVDGSPIVNGRGNTLRRELSDLELGELREPMPEEAPGVKKKFERKSSFKQSESKPSTSDNWNLDMSKVKTAGKATLDSRKPSPPNVNAGVLSNPEGLSKKRTPEHYVEDLTKPQNRVVQSQPQHLSRADHAEVGSQFNKFTDASGKSRQNEAGASQGIGLEGYGESHKKAPVGAMQQHDTKRGLVPHSTKESRTQISITVADLTDRRKDTIFPEDNNGVRKRRESSSDEDSCSYSKYEKDEPELKGPIKDLSQYKEYVQEYRDKYESYCSLSKILETYRDEFHKLGKDLEIARGRDMERYYYILGQLKDSYRQCGTRHKRLKGIFIVLHEELKNLKQRIKDYALSYTKD